jgi:outer membrane protein assembly factor BamE (lipoprotein component of BamABCDE complex)
MKRISCALFLLLGACSSQPQITQTEARQIKVGVTDKATVQSILGAPTARSMAPTGEEQWVYYQTQGNLLTGVNAQNAQIWFRNDVVSRCMIDSDKGGAMFSSNGEKQLFDCGSPVPPPPAAAKKRT